VFIWGGLSDRIGARLVLVFGCLGVGLSMLALGFSRSLGSVIAFRAAGGMLSGNMAVLKAALSDVRETSLEKLTWPDLRLEQHRRVRDRRGSDLHKPRLHRLHRHGRDRHVARPGRRRPTRTPRGAMAEPRRHAASALSVPGALRGRRDHGHCAGGAWSRRPRGCTSALEASLICSAVPSPPRTLPSRNR